MSVTNCTPSKRSAVRYGTLVLGLCVGLSVAAALLVGRGSRTEHMNPQFPPLDSPALIQEGEVGSGSLGASVKRVDAVDMPHRAALGNANDDDPAMAQLPESVRRVLKEYNGTVEQYELMKRYKEEQEAIYAASPSFAFEQQIVTKRTKPEDILSQTIRPRLMVAEISIENSQAICKALEAILQAFREDHSATLRALGLDIAAPEFNYAYLVAREAKWRDFYPMLDSAFAVKLVAFENECLARLGGLKREFKSYVLRNDNHK